MSAYFRPRMPGACIFFTVCLAARGDRLLVDEIDRLRSAVGLTRRARPFHVDAWVVLPDHMHAVWTLPEGDADYSVRWGAIKARFTRSLRDDCRAGFHPENAKRTGHAVGWNPTLRKSASKARKGDAGIWQRRFWEHHVRSAAEYEALVTYCWQNPVKHGFVAQPEDWPYSSMHREMRLRRA
ncbi:transposase [Roseovarius spongiae]|uniref:Transposase n=1 Tax=Roseovarius spongiae TaxID=2320272 RepID=A0A3A8B7M9_9RHOB|nr:transposase [Roseovarius spongiae]RKF12909.1 transposase [Roseovarius spongiae]